MKARSISPFGNTDIFLLKNSSCSAQPASQVSQKVKSRSPNKALTDVPHQCTGWRTEKSIIFHQSKIYRASYCTKEQKKTGKDLSGNLEVVSGFNFLILDHRLLLRRTKLYRESTHCLVFLSYSIFDILYSLLWGHCELCVAIHLYFIKNIYDIIYLY